MPAELAGGVCCAEDVLEVGALAGVAGVAAAGVLAGVFEAAGVTAGVAAGALLAGVAVGAGAAEAVAALAELVPFLDVAGFLVADLVAVVPFFAAAPLAAAADG